MSDYIVAGAGAAGSVVVRRLLDAGHSVHVLESGPVDTDPASIRRRVGRRCGRSAGLGVFTTPQRHANGRRIFWPRGKVLGGSGSLNGMIYIRGHADDYDRWATAAGDSGWAWKRVLPLFERSRELLPVSGICEPHRLSEAFVDGAIALGYKPIGSFNGGELVGVGYNEATTLEGQRMSAWKSFVAPVLGHRRLTVTTEALVHRLIVEGGNAVGVEFSQGRGDTTRVYAESEIVLSGGVLGSPKMLLLSGIGPATHLESVGIEPVVGLPGVGENLHDHLLISNIYAARDELPAGKGNLLEAQLYTHAIMPTVPHGNTNAPSMMVGERASDLILN